MDVRHVDGNTIISTGLTNERLALQTPKVHGYDQVLKLAETAAAYTAGTVRGEHQCPIQKRHVHKLCHHSDGAQAEHTSMQARKEGIDVV
jgi:hypothetical protein